MVLFDQIQKGSDGDFLRAIAEHHASKRLHFDEVSIIDGRHWGDLSTQDLLKGVPATQQQRCEVRATRKILEMLAARRSWLGD